VVPPSPNLSSSMLSKCLVTFIRYRLLFFLRLNFSKLFLQVERCLPLLLRTMMQLAYLFSPMVPVLLSTRMFMQVLGFFILVVSVLPLVFCVLDRTKSFLWRKKLLMLQLRIMCALKNSSLFPISSDVCLIYTCVPQAKRAGRRPEASEARRPEAGGMGQMTRKASRNLFIDLGPDLLVFLIAPSNRTQKFPKFYGPTACSIYALYAL